MKTRLTSKNLTQDLVGKKSIGLYPASLEPVALVDIASVGVVVPLDAVQECCSADQPDDVRRHQEEEDDVSSRAANDTPQKYDCRPSPVQMNPKTASVPEAYSFQNWCTQVLERGELLGQQNFGYVCKRLSHSKNR